MYFPITIIDDFYDNFENIKNYSNQLEYFDRHKLNRPYSMPGKITNAIHEINPSLFLSCTRKILSIFYNKDELLNISYECTTRFEKIVPYNINYNEKGFIHSDDNYTLTGLLYIQGDSKEGTSFFKLKNINKSNVENFKIKETVYSGNSIDPNIYNESLFKHNENYEEILNVALVPNRIVLFDSSLYHASNGLGNFDKPRILQTFFFHKIKTSHYPMPELRRHHI